jgi:hypothetical protein
MIGVLLALAALTPFPFGDAGFSGTWRCTGQFANGRAHVSNYAAKPVLDGKWLELTETDVDPASGYEAIYLIGFDPAQAALVEYDANTFASAVYTSADGWKDGQLVMTSPVHASGSRIVQDRFVYQATRSGTFAIDWQVKTSADSDWKTSDHLQCGSTGAG